MCRSNSERAEEKRRKGEKEKRSGGAEGALRVRLNV
jgi:hypothetical protein